MIPVYINNCNRLTWVVQMLGYLETVPDVRPIIVDNASTYPPLVDWYRRCPVQLIKLPVNGGPRAIWNQNVDLPKNRYFAVTDPDLDLSGVPTDFMDVLCGGLDNNPDIGKCGLSLEINDLPPDLPDTHRVLRHEGKWWVNRHDERFWAANVATTMAVYKSHRPRYHYRPALRADRPYTARHIPWYISIEDATEEDLFYWQHLEHCRTISWSARLGKRHGAARK